MSDIHNDNVAKQSTGNVVNDVILKGVSMANRQLLISLQQLIGVYQVKIAEQLNKKLSALTAENEQQSVKINTALDKIFNLALMHIFDYKRDLAGNNMMIELKSFFKAVCGSLINQVLKKATVISLMENILECLAVSDLGEILSDIFDQICGFGSTLGASDQSKLLRIINRLLKNISKTEDYHIRGELQFSLTKFLPICHDSGFNYKTHPAKGSEPQTKKELEARETEQLGLNLEDSLSFEFYQQFWNLQRYFADPNELAVGDPQYGKTQPKGKQKESLTLLRLKGIYETVKEIQKYFIQCPEQQITDFNNRPLKFLKNFNLFSLQLRDAYFRKVIMLQLLIFASSLKTVSTTNTIIIGDPQKRVINQIQKIALQFLKNTGINNATLYEQFAQMLKNELYWIELKDNWKERKKTFFRKQEIVKDETQLKNQKMHAVECQKRRETARRQIRQKMKIDGSNLEKFLAMKEPISLVQQPSTTSFSYYYQQAVNCLNSFDFVTGKQNEFESRSEYNIFEWKAMRSLYRENIHDITSNLDKNSGKAKDYRLIALMNRKQGDLCDGVRLAEQPLEGDTLRKIVKE